MHRRRAFWRGCGSSNNKSGQEDRHSLETHVDLYTYCSFKVMDEETVRLSTVEWLNGLMLKSSQADRLGPFITSRKLAML